MPTLGCEEATRVIPPALAFMVPLVRAIAGRGRFPRPPNIRAPYPGAISPGGQGRARAGRPDSPWLGVPGRLQHPQLTRASGLADTQRSAAPRDSLNQSGRRGGDGRSRDPYHPSTRRSPPRSPEGRRGGLGLFSSAEAWRTF